jgi:transposase
LNPHTPRRAVVDAILFVVRTGCAWRQLPVDFPPWQTVYWYFNQWEQAKVTEQILPVVRGQLRVQEGRAPEPSAGLIDSQSVKGADTVGRDSRGYDAGKKINGRKRFIVTDTLGLLLCIVVLSAGLQDRDGAKPVLLDSYLRTPVRFVFADGAFAGRLLGWADTILRTTLHIVRKPADQRGFAIIPRRWAVERTFSWITAHRRLARELRTRSRHLRGHDPLGRDQHHHPPDRPRRASDPPTEAHLQTRQLIFSNTLLSGGQVFIGWTTAAMRPVSTASRSRQHPCHDRGSTFARRRQTSALRKSTAS